MKTNLFKVKEGKLDQWKDWCNLLVTKFKTEALETLKEEENVYEAFILFKLGSDYYTLGFGEGNNLPGTEKELNLLHKKHKGECLERVGEPGMLYELRLQDLLNKY